MEFSEHEAGPSPVSRYIWTKVLDIHINIFARTHAHEHDASNLGSETQIVHGPLYIVHVVLHAEAGSTTQNNKTEITYNSTTIELLYY